MLNNLSVLFVEDDILTQEQMRILLEDEVGAFYQAYNAEDGFEILNEKDPDIIITDISLPMMNGLEMAEKIKSLKPDIPIVVVSAHEDTKFFLKAINEIGIDYYFLKPIKTEELLSNLKKIAQKIKDKHEERHIAYKDPLTKIYNRRIFDEKLKELLQRGKKFTLFFMDLDNFKFINDNYGHIMGDEVLKIFVKRIKNIIRDEDLFIRIGGDEFALILENVDDYAIKTIADKIINSMKDFKIEDKRIGISCSIGIKTYENENLKEFLKSVDKALYKVKNEGKSGYCILN